MVLDSFGNPISFMAVILVWSIYWLALPHWEYCSIRVRLESFKINNLDLKRTRKRGCFLEKKNLCKFSTTVKHNIFCYSYKFIIIFVNNSKDLLSNKHLIYIRYIVISKIKLDTSCLLAIKYGIPVG